MNDTLHIAEQFHSIQGEGRTAGQPAVFLRLQHCTLNCVWCDTADVWKKGTPWTIDALLGDWQQKGWLARMQSRQAALVVTGGSPLMQQKALLTLFERLEGVRIEVETEGVLVPDLAIASYVDQWNVSPKLTNSGMPETRRVRPDAIGWHAGDWCSTFKFVVTAPEDVEELERTYVKPFLVSPSNVYLMPEGVTAEALAGRYVWLAEVCKERGYNLTTRLQVLIWGKTTGV